MLKLLDSKAHFLDEYQESRRVGPRTMGLE